MAKRDANDDMEVVPTPASETDEERRRIRESNTRDQDLERRGKRSRHNEGYDEVADGTPPSHTTPGSAEGERDLNEQSK